MMNVIWLSMMWLSVFFGLWNQKIPEVTSAFTEGVRASFDTLLGISGMVLFWSGLMAIAEASGLIEKIGHAIYPVLRFLFPTVPRGHPAFGAIALVLSANALGLNNAATPLGIKAMESLATLNEEPHVASDDMCMLVTINASSIQLIPASTIAFLSLYGCDHPSALLLPATLATMMSTMVGILSVWAARRLRSRRKHA